METTQTTKPTRRTTEQQITALNKKLEQALTRQLREKWAQEQREKAQAKRSESDKRKAETRRKIELGGLVIVAGAQNLDEATLVGLIAMAMSSAMVDPQRMEHARQKGLDLMTARPSRSRV